MTWTRNRQLGSLDRHKQAENEVVLFTSNGVCLYHPLLTLCCNEDEVDSRSCFLVAFNSQYVL